jgi:hypothetical protein
MCVHSWDRDGCERLEDLEVVDSDFNDVMGCEFDEFWDEVVDQIPTLYLEVEPLGCVLADLL